MLQYPVFHHTFLHVFLQPLMFFAWISYYSYDCQMIFLILSLLSFNCLLFSESKSFPYEDYFYSFVFNIFFLLLGSSYLHRPSSSYLLMLCFYSVIYFASKYFFLLRLISRLLTYVCISVGERLIQCWERGILLAMSCLSVGYVFRFQENRHTLTQWVFLKLTARGMDREARMHPSLLQGAHSPWQWT